MRIARQAFWAAISALAISQTSFAAISASPNPNPDGNYTVSWDAYGGDWYELKQRKNGGAQTTYTLSASSSSKAFSSKSAGTYTYELFYCEDFGHPDEFECYNTGYGIAEVVVQPLPWPDADPMTEQLTYDYETRRGDINSDGRQDLFLNRLTVTESGNGTIEQLILKQTVSGSFDLLVPNGAQIAAASAWTPVGVNISVADINMDGFVDVSLGDISSAIAGTLDQIIFSSGQILVQTPMGSRSVDADFLTFVDEVGQWMSNQNYFDDNAIWIPGTNGYWDWDWECEFEWGGDGWDCGWVPVWIPGSPGYWSYDHFNQEALNYCTTMEELESSGGMTPGSPQAATIQQVFEQVFGGSVMDGIFASGEIVIEIPPVDTSSDTPWWRVLRAQMVLVFTMLSLSGDTPQELPLYRVVEAAELIDIVNCHCFRTIPGQQEIKQFWKNEVDAMWFGTEGMKALFPGSNGVPVARTLLRIMVSRQVYNQGIPGSEPFTSQGHLSYFEPQLLLLNADIATKVIMTRYYWSPDPQ